MRIGIVGAGLSGLATAFWLQRARPDWELAIFEAEPAPGGALHTAVVDGFRFEAGCNGFLTNRPDSLELVAASGAESLLLASSPAARKRFVYTDRLRRLPETPAAFLASGLLSPRAKLRALAEPFIGARRDAGDETLQAFGYRRLGAGFTDVFLDALTAGMYGSTPARLSVAAAFPLIAALEREHGGLLRGMLARRKRSAGPGGVLMSFRGGVGSFVTHLEARIRADWHLGTPVRALVRSGAGFSLTTSATTVPVDRAVVAVPAHAAAPILAGLDAGLAANLARIEYTPIAVVGLGYRHLDHALDGFGLLTTAAARQPLLGVLWDSSVFQDRAPAGGKILRALLGGQRNPSLVGLEPESLVTLARSGIRATMGVDAEPDTAWVRRWPRGIPNYGLGHLASVAAIDAAVAQVPGLYLGGNAYHGVAMNDCCRNSRLLAERIVVAAGAAQR